MALHQYVATEPTLLRTSPWLISNAVDGALTLGVFVMFVLLMPMSPGKTRPIHGLFDLFNDRDRAIMHTRVVAHDRSKVVARAHITWNKFVGAITDFRLWLHMILNIVALAPKGGLALYGPSIIKSLGFDTTKANLLNSVSSYMVVVLSFLISWASDRTGLRGPWCIVAYLWSIVFGAALLGIGAKSDKWLRYAIFTLLGAGNALAQGLNDAWLNVNARTPEKRSIGLAMVVMGSNMGGIAGPSLFQASDAPRYVHGFAAILGLYGASILVTLAIMSVYWHDNRKLTRKQNEGEDMGEDRHFQL